MIADAGTASPKTYWVQTDHLERPVMMLDSGKAVVWRANYLPFGEVASITGPASLDMRFPGQWFQLESGLHYNWHRHYDPTTGRYIQPDPLGMPDGPSRWAYVRNSPLMGVDPTGLIWRLGPGGNRWWCPNPVTILGCVLLPPRPSEPPLACSIDPDDDDAPAWMPTEPLPAPRPNREDECYERCKHLMGVGHGNEYRGCYRRCMGEPLGGDVEDFIRDKKNR